MRSTMRACVAPLALALAIAAPCQALAQDKAEKPGSRHVQCDGQPNNMSTGESAARLLGAVTLLALFAPPPEAPDASKRKFGDEGVQICSSLIDGEAKETNAFRRINLILGRAIHRIEAKDYAGAIADAALARQEAEAGGYMANPYYALSQGRAFDLVEAAALYRDGKTAEARDAALRNIAASRYAYVNLLRVPGYLLDERTPSATEASYFGWRTRLATYGADSHADRLEEWGRFKDAAEVREALVDLDKRAQPDRRSTAWLAKSAISLALSGNTGLAAERIAEAKANAEKRKTEGNPEKAAGEIVELFDLYGILQSTLTGDVRTARRLFSARSQWVAASFGSVAEVTRRLRDGAAPDELIGGLAHDPDWLWKDRADTRRAEVLAKDSDNKTLFAMIPGVDSARSYESLSKQVWRTDKSKLLLTVKDSAKSPLKMERLFLYSYGAGFEAVLQAYALHAALLAKARGQQGFVMMPIIGDNLVAAGFITGNLGDPGLQAPLFNNADEVIAELSQVIPSPETLKQRAKSAK